MIQANLQIIQALQAFLQLVAYDEEVRPLFSLHPRDFSRQRQLPLARVAQLIINQPKRSLAIEVQELFEKVFPEEAACGKSAFCQQRTKLKASFFYLWNQTLVAAFEQFYAGQLKRWKGYRLLATDGSCLYLFNNPEVVGYFGTKANQFGAVAMARALQVYDVLNHLVLWADLFSIQTSEQQVAYHWAEDYPCDALLLFDRGFCSYTMMYLLGQAEREKHFVIRARTGFKVVQEFLKSRQTSRVVNLYPSQHSISRLSQHGYHVTPQTAIQVRLIKVPLPNRPPEVLLTNVYDESLKAADFKEVYGLRWGVEGRWNYQKNQQQIEVFSGHRVLTIFQDYYASIFIANLQSLIEKQCTVHVTLSSERRKHTYKINRNLCWAYLKFRVVKLFIDPDPLRILIQLQKCFEKNLEPERLGRHISRAFKQRRLTGKYQTFTNYRRTI